MLCENASIFSFNKIEMSGIGVALMTYLEKHNSYNTAHYNIKSTGHVIINQFGVTHLYHTAHPNCCIFYCLWKIMSGQI